MWTLCLQKHTLPYRTDSNLYQIKADNSQLLSIILQQQKSVAVHILPIWTQSEITEHPRLCKEVLRESSIGGRSLSLVIKDRSQLGVDIKKKRRVGLFWSHAAQSTLCVSQRGFLGFQQNRLESQDLCEGVTFPLVQGKICVV